MNKMIPVPLLVEEENLAPVYATEGASGADVRARLKEPVVLQPGAFALIPTGVKLAVPIGYEIQVRPRSGLAAKHGISVLNTPGTVDADYRGEIQVILINLGAQPFAVEPNMRIAQIVLCPVVQAQFLREGELAETARGEGGFGHTGTK